MTLLLASILGALLDRIAIVLWNAYKKRPYSYTDCVDNEETLKNWLEEKNNLN